MKRFRFGITFRLLAGLTSLVLLTAGAGLLALFALNAYQRALDEVAQQHLPALASSAALVQQTQKLVATAPALIVAESQYERHGLMLRITAQKASIDEQLDALKRFGLGTQESAAITQVQTELVENLGELDTAVERKIDQDQQMQNLAQELRQLRERVQVLEGDHSSDGGVGQIRETLAGSSSSRPTARQLFDREIAAQGWFGQSNEIVSLLLTAFDGQNRGALDSIRIQLLDAIDRIGRSVGALPETERVAAQNIVMELATLGLHERGLLDLRAQQIEAARTEQLALERNRRLADQLVAAVSGPQERITQAALDLGAATSESTRRTARSLFLIVVAGFVAASVILIYISRSVINRLRRLQISMQGRQAGLKTPIDTTGHDEIAEMAQALDFFVRTISESEAETKRAFVELKATQATLIQAEKLASLGQLTSGISHEIKNPLNFIENFSEISLAICDELKHAFDTGDRAGQDEAFGFLKSNLSKIRSHGKYADGIVRIMMLHSRPEGEGERQLIEFNVIVEEALTLARHHARGKYPDFQVTIERDFQPRLGSVEISHQDIIRVLMNVFDNAFYAVLHRDADQAAKAEPSVSIMTRGDDDTVEVRITDNGKGMTTEELGKIYVPFFSTKPTSVGTGLGLSIAYEIVTGQHRGQVQAKSDLGEHTTMTISLPRRTHAKAPPLAKAIPAA
ncbi:MAG: ATP-binding protein [Aliidongia sp.]